MIRMDCWAGNACFQPFPTTAHQEVNIGDAIMNGAHQPMQLMLKDRDRLEEDEPQEDGLDEYSQVEGVARQLLPELDAVEEAVPKAKAKAKAKANAEASQREILAGKGKGNGKVKGKSSSKGGGMTPEEWRKAEATRRQAECRARKKARTGQEAHEGQPEAQPEQSQPMVPYKSPEWWRNYRKTKKDSDPIVWERGVAVEWGVW